MRNWDTLPNEILTLFLNGLDSIQDVQQFQLTCKAWTSIAQQQLYAQINLKTEGQLQSFVNQIKANRSLGQIVERLYTNSVLTGYLLESLKYFIALAEYCPNIKCIDVVDFDQESTQWLIDVLQEGKWQKMNRIRYPGTSRTCMRLYAQAASIMQERLIELRINDAFEDGSFGRRLAYNTDTFNSLANGIDSFPKLQYLTLMRHDYIHIFDFDEYIDKCVTIKRLEIHVTIPFPNNDLDRVFYERRMVTDMSHIKQQNAISQLFVSLTLFNDDTLTYIIRKFPSLSTLDLACFDDNKRYRNVLPSLSKDVCLEFFSYISKIRDFRIMKLPIRNACGVLSSALINKIRSEKKSIVLKISYCSSGCIDIRTEPKNYIMTVELPFDRTESSLPHLQLLENLGDQVASLDIRLDHESYLDHNSTRAEDDVLVNMKKGNFLDHILENRSNLQRLDVTGPFLVHCSPHIQANKNLAHLSLTHCDIYLGLLPELSLQLPSLKQLEIDHCEVVSEDGTAFLKKPVLNVCMPQTSLDKITFRNPLSAAFVQGFCIKIEDHAGKETYYKRAHLETTVLTGPQAEHEYHLMRDGYLNIYIQCTSIKHISLFLFNIENEIDC